MIRRSEIRRSKIRRSKFVAAALLFASAVAHASALSINSSATQPALAGGAATSVTQLGNSFQDMSVGTMTAQAPQTHTQDISRTVQSRDTPATSTDALETTQTTATESVQSSVAAMVSPKASVLKPVQQVETIAVSPQAVSVPVTVPVIVTAQTPPALEKPIQKALPQITETTPRVSRRPAVRPKSLDVAQAHAPQKKPTQSVQDTPKPQRGNADRNARAGVTQGQAKAKAAVAAPRQATANTKAANAAVSNYPGLVMRRLARQKRPRAATKGTAIVSFSIVDSGAVNRATIAQSSGSPQLDRDAVALVRRAAPFPAPPKGAKRAFKVRIKGR
ncbi:TonB family protein [Ascidiaceihabitans sp.]|uniref:energy transducer TonB family protein n=1 Tax=Ascidiaceihabitans sp. TaxID=1872644 RepID=UPI00329A74A6